MAEDNVDSGPPATKAKMPPDAFTFLKQEPQHTHYPPTQPHPYAFHGAPSNQGTSVIQSTKPVGTHALPQPISTSKYSPLFHCVSMIPTTHTHTHTHTHLIEGYITAMYA